jgi:hypothetical protein
VESAESDPCMGTFRCFIRSYCLMPEFPLSLITVIVLDAAGFLLLAISAFHGIRFFAAVGPVTVETAGGECLSVFVERADRAGRIAFFFFCVSTALAISLIALVLPTILPGAACGSDVIQAGGGGGMLSYRLIVLAVLYVWYHRNRLDRLMPGAPLRENNLRLLMAALPIAFLLLKSAIVFARGLSDPGWVNCCAVVYDAAGNLERFSPGGRGLGRPGLFALHGLSAVFLFAGGWAVRRRKLIPAFRPSWIWVFVPVWSFIAYLVVVYGYADDFLMDPAPDCPWCLLLPRYRFVGFVYFTCIVFAGLEGFIAAHMFGIAVRYKPPSEPAMQRFWAACRHLVLLVLIFYLVSAGTQLAWQIGVEG